MESESDGEEMLEATYSSMEQPPLIKQLRGILSEYPDNGQIIKEMLQNAEDAEASQVEIIYDERCINQGEDKKKIFRKFFKGPALCVKNDSLFSCEDWRGIKMIASSIKEEDKLKVGRFGLGFKSVFHMTDYPCIMSGDRILMVDPTRPSDQVNAEIKLKHMRKTKGMDVDAFFHAFRDALNIDESIIDQGSYNGTVFWFPLREETSKISSTVYNREKVTDLFASFEHDSSEILLFLCHLESVSLHFRNENGELSSVASAEISENKTNVRRRREDFVKSIKEISRSGQSHEPVTCTFEMTLSTRSQNKSVNNTSWIIVHYFMGTNCSSKLKQLVNDPDIGFNPLVGVAMPTSNIEQPFEGHVFCFMPLPREGSRLTGLPVHVNGFFSLSQNRHHLKWATDDQRIREIKDKDILWNQALIEECVPEAYKMLFEILLQKAKENEIDIQSIGGLCRVVADEKSVMDKWKKIPNQLINYLNQLKFLYSHCQSRFVLIRDALFTTEESRNSDIQCVISQLNVNYVEASMTTISKLKFYNGNKVRELTPSMMADLLRQKVSIFSKLSESQRLSILSYLFSGNNYNSCLAGLPLLPAASDEWLTFGGREGVYICKSSEMTNLFEECKGRLIHRTAEMSDYIWRNLENMAAYRIAQIRKLDVTAFRELLKRSLQVKVGPSNIISNQAQLEWFKRVWEYIAENFSLDQFEEVPLMPELKEGNWNNCKKIQLHPLKGIFLKKNNMPDSIARCFHSLGTVVLNDLPSWFPEHFVSTYLCVYRDNDSTDICNLLQKLWNQPNSQRQVKINSFNSNTSCNDRDQFVKFMSNQTNLNGGCFHLLRSLRVFKYGDCMSNSTSFTSFNDHQSFVQETEIPFILPRSFILASEDSVHLLQTLGAQEVTLVDQIQLVLKELKKGSKYSKEETKRFMNYLIDNSWLFLKSKAIMDLAQEIPFLKTEHGTSKAKDLFCPEDDLLKEMFCGETDKFPLEYLNFSSQGKTALKQLGLKETSMVSAQDIGDVVSLIQQWCRNPTKYNTCVTKSNAVLLLLNKNSSLLKHTYKRSSLDNDLLQQRFVVCNQEKPCHFPASLPQFKEKFCTPKEARERSYDNECLVGATMPLVDPIYGNLSSSFGWNYLPPVDKVIEQLILIKNYFKATEKSCSVPLIGKIYKYLTKNIRRVDYSKFQMEGLVWTGDSFEHPKNVIIRVESQGLTDLRPYFFGVPLEFTTYEDLFKTIGCIPEQNVSVLIDALLRIQKTHDIPQSYEVYDKDFKLAVKIVDKLAERRHEIQGHEVILPVQSDSSSQIKFHPASKCTVDKNAARFVHEEGDNTIVFVNQKVSHDSAKALGAKPLNKQVLMGTESMGIEGFGQTEKLTDRISKLITESYVDGLSVPKELIQNADDAGASVVKFLFDEREHGDARNLLLSREMAECQGPALVVFNNASFSDADFENIKKLNGATKEMDKSKVGRFGLGFCAVYNLTDVPSFISRSTVVIFDPQKSYLKDALEDNSPGIKIDFKKTENRKLLRLHEDQFKPYKGLFECDIDNLPRKEFNGTIFRLPLRTSSQAELSEISKLSYNRDEVCELLTMLAKNIGNMLLFTQSVQKIELYHLPKQAKSFENKVLLFSACKMLKNTIPKSLQDTSCTILQRVATALSTGKHFVQTEQLNIRVSLTSECSHLLRKIDDAVCSDDSSWIVVWETGKKESLALARKVREEKAVPLAAVAVQCDPEFQSPLKQSDRSTPFYERGHLFCFLPLPIETSLAFHLNGSFHVTSDRRRLVSLTDDDKTSRNDRWNEYIMSDASVNALFTLLEYFSQRNNGGLYLFHQLWPLHYQLEVTSIHESFFQRIIQEERPLFWGNGKWAPFSEIAFLDPSIRSDPGVGEIGFKMLSSIGTNKGKTLVDLPCEFVKCLVKVVNVDECVIQETEFLGDFLENMSSSYWNGQIEIRNTILVYAVKSDNSQIKDKMKKYRCIPVEPRGQLKRPCDVVHNKGKVSSLFENEDEVFLHSSLQKPDVMLELVKLGMIKDRLSDEMLAERFSTVEILARKKYSSKALYRCKLLFQYLSDVQIEKDLQDKEELKRQIQNLYVVPVLTRPRGWKFSWKSENSNDLLHVCDADANQKQDQLLFGKASDLYMKQMYHCGGTVCCFVHEDLLKKDVNVTNSAFRVLQLNEEVTTNIVIQNICQLCEEYDESEEKFKLLQNIFTKTLDCLQKRLKSGDEDLVYETQFELSKLTEKQVVLVGKRFYHPYKVAFEFEQDCPPYLMKLPPLYTNLYKETFQIIGIKQHFAASDIMAVLLKIKDNWSNGNDTEIETILKVLQNLDKCEDFNCNTTYNIVAPDIHGNLFPINELVITDEQFETDRTMHTIHQGIAPELARKLGAKDKQTKCYEDITFGIPFGQKEKLVSRLKNLIDAYPCDSSIMKELLQNADDAGASEIHFIKDYRNHTTDRIFGDSCKGIQGPSLCVFNDSYFTDNDLKGIHDLGEGSKRDDPTKTGQYGVGFNSVYHLTDTPSFLTVGPDLPDDGLLVIFDPTCKHLPKVREDEPGVKCEVKHLQANFPGVLQGFSMREKLFSEQKGTLFRLPLRTENSDISKKVETKMINSMLGQMSEDMFESLLFVKSVERIRISNITSGELKEEYSVWTEMSDEDRSRRTDFFKYIEQVSRDNKLDKKGLIEVEKREVSYQMKLLDSRGRSETFLVVQQFGFENPSDVPSSIIQAYNDKVLGCLPLGGVAFKANEDIKNINISSVSKAPVHQAQQHQKQREFKGQMFCFLPIPEESFVPVHVNAHFALDDARRGLIRDGYKKEWNDCLMKYIVTPAYAKCIDQWRLFLGRDATTLNTWALVNYFSERYHKIFPLKKKEPNDSSSSLLIRYLYSIVVSRSDPLFPVFRATNELHQDVSGKSSGKIVKWVSLGINGNVEKGCFNTLYSLFSYENSIKDMRALEALLKEMGMDILQTPYSIKVMIEKCDAGKPACTDPEGVIHYYSLVSKSLSLVGNLEKTAVKTKRNLQLLLYVMTQSTESFMKFIQQLPVLLTNDNNLKVFSREDPVYNSVFCWMFPEHSHKFIDPTIYYHLCEQLLKEGYMADFKETSFIELIPYQYKQILCSGLPVVLWDRSDDKFPPPKWIAWFWKFVLLTSGVDTSDNEKFRETMMKFSDWTLIPAVKDDQSVLVKINHAYTLVDLISFFRNEQLKNSIKKLSPFVLDEGIFEKGIFSSSLDRERKLISTIFRRLLSQATSEYKPESLLEFLYFKACSKDFYGFTNVVDTENALSILKYFNGHTDNERFLNHKSFEKKLLALPLFETVFNRCVALIPGKDVVVIPSSIPITGLDIFSSNLNLILLKTNSSLSDIFKILKLKSITKTKFYTDFLLPNISKLPRQSWMDHIKFIKDYLLKYGFSSDEDNEQKSMVYQLSGIPFINTVKGYKRCSEFYTTQNEIFKALCHEDEFLPEDFRTAEWERFAEALGLNVNLNDDIMIDFANRIANAQPLNQSTIGKAEILSKYFVLKIDSWKTSTLQRLSNICFIPPLKIDDTFSSIFPARNNSVQLICTQDAVESQHVGLCWSTLHILPFKVWTFEKPSELCCSYMGVHSEPPVIDVIKHCQNISTVLRQKIDKYSRSDIESLMNVLYEFLLKNQRAQVKDMLQDFPIIHLPVNKKMVRVNEIVLEIAGEDVIEPYLFKAPIEYGPYWKLFQFIGTSSEVKCFHFIGILGEVFRKAGSKELSYSELRIVRTAVQNLNMSIKKESKRDFGNIKLFLPNIKKIMCLATTLVMVDNDLLFSRMKGMDCINYFLGSSELLISDFDVVSFVDEMPQELCPMLLSNITREKFNTENLKFVQNSIAAQKISLFIQSEEFVRGICRILRGYYESKDADFNSIDKVEEIKTRLSQITVIEVEEIQTYLLYENEIVEGSQCSQECFLDEDCDSDRVNFYFRLQHGSFEKSLSTLIMLPNGISEAIRKYAGISFSGVLVVASMMGLLDNPDGISRLLDKYSYPMLDVDIRLRKVSVFPKPGTYVEEKFYPFLNQGLDCFDKSEYLDVALELEDEEFENDFENVTESNPIYIYVQIVKELNSNEENPSLVTIRYLIDNGSEELVEVAGSSLYRFVRPENDTDSLAHYTGGDPQQYLPFDENCRRISQMLEAAWSLPDRERRRVFRRLILQWHPDRNRGSEEYATKVFQFIQQCILRLEQTGSLSDRDETDGRPPDFFNSSFNQMYTNMNRRAQAYARAYHNNLDEYNRSQRTGNFSHRNATLAEVRDVGEARRWMKQAKRDFQAAEAFLPQADDQKAFNWICYMCHQASEKALKAACYSKNANAVSLQDHSLQSPAMNLSPSLTSLAGQMENHLGHHTRMRYPNSVS